MARIFIHVGPHKTGTTFLQDVLIRNRKNLATQGVCIPMNGSSQGQAPHHNLAWDIASRKDRFKDSIGGIDALREEVKSESHVIITSEAFSSFPHCFFRIVNPLIADGHDVTSVFVARDQLSIINSAYTQRLKSFHLDKSFDAYFAGALNENRYDNFEFYKELWATKANNKVIPYTKQNLLNDFLDATDTRHVKLDIDHINANANASPNNYETEIIRLFAKELKGTGKDFQTCLNELKRIFSESKLLLAQGFWGPSLEQRKQAEDSFRQMNRIFKLRFDLADTTLITPQKERTCIVFGDLSSDKQTEIKRIGNELISNLSS